MHWLTYARFRAEEAEAAARFWPKTGLQLTLRGVVDRLLELADLPPERTNGNITAQVNALGAIAEIEGYL
jgi:PHP family Zn ribbon phosphoesterase